MTNTKKYNELVEKIKELEYWQEIELTENMENSIGYQTLRNDDCMISEKDKVFFSQ